MSMTNVLRLAQGPVSALVERARAAQARFETFSQAQVDGIVRDMARYVYDHAETLAEMAVAETGIGCVEDKILKNKGKARVIWHSLKGKASRGVIGEDAETHVTLVAKPMGVVGAVTPVTNPIVTPMCNGMFALKTGNAVIFAPHPKAQECTRHLADAFMEIVRAHGGPEDLIQVVVDGSVDKTQALMESVDVVVATGGPGMVKAAYSSGRPSFGVGAGNVPVIIDRDADLIDAIAMIVTGASFDHGIICSHEQFVLVPREKLDDAVSAFRANQGVWYTDDPVSVQKLRDTLFPDGVMNKDAVGKSASTIGAMAGLDVPSSARLLLVPAMGAGSEDTLAREKLFPVVAILPYDTFEDAIEFAKANLLLEGAGHSAAIHSHDDAHVRQAGLALPISRLVVNQPSSLTAGGSLTNGFAPTTTLGCGSWGGNSISENLDFKHLMNVSRIGRLIPDRVVPTDEEIFA